MYYVVFFELSFTSFADALDRAPEDLARHRSRSTELHDRGEVLMAGAFLDDAGGHLGTMAIFPSREAAEAYIAADPFVASGAVTRTTIRPWADMFGAARR